MFNNLPGQGLGFTGSKLIAFGLNPITITIVIGDQGGSGGSYRRMYTRKDPPEKKRKKTYVTHKTPVEVIKVIENSYSINQFLTDDEELFDILQIVFGIIKDE